MREAARIVLLSALGSLVLLAAGLVLTSCNHSSRDQAWVKLRTRRCDVYMPAALTQAQRGLVLSSVATCENEYNTNLRRAPSGVNPIGALPAQPRLTVYAHKGAVSSRPGNRILPEPYGWSENGVIHVSAGGCFELPGLFHGMVHAWAGMPGPPHDPGWVATDLLGNPVRSLQGTVVDTAWVVWWNAVVEQFIRNSRACP